MSSNQEILNNFMNSVDLNKGKVCEFIIPHPHMLRNGTDINLVNGNNGICLDYGKLNKRTFIKFPSFDTPDILVNVNLCDILPTWEKSNRLELKFNNREEQYLCCILLSFLIRSHISSIFEEPNLKTYKNDTEKWKNDMFIPEKISGLETIKAIRNRNKKKFKKNFKNWKKYTMTSQEDIEDFVMDGDLYSEKKSTISYYGDDIEVNEEAYRKICEDNKKKYNEFISIDMIAEKVGWW